MKGDVLKTAAVLAAMTVIWVSASFYTVSHARITETVIVLGEATQAEYRVNLFKTEYADTAGNVIVGTQNMDNIIAPGISGEHVIRLKNENAFTVEYTMDVGTSAVYAPDIELPICVRVTGGLSSPKSWQRIVGTVSETLRGKLGPGQEMSFYYQWEWKEADDRFDTWLAGEYEDMTLKVIADISAGQWISVGPDADGDSDGPATYGSGTKGPGMTDFLKRTVLSGFGNGRGSIGPSYHESGPGELGWINVPESGDWYYSTARDYGNPGLAYTGWLYESRDGRWYYLDPDSGKMCAGWREIEGSWYYFTTREDADDHDWRGEYTAAGYLLWNYYGQGAHSYGAMYTGEYTPDGYFVDSAGRWVEGG